ncbi:MAG TPA: hypothetical protein DD414_12320, partial [Lachnospiraceae bacterium]|nr:hypothetical protein [Lachnospiraceae bacterium]
PAEAINPMELTIARITRNEMLTRRSCKAMGVPSVNILPILFLSKQIQDLVKVKGSSLFLMISKDK